MGQYFCSILLLALTPLIWNAVLNLIKSILAKDQRLFSIGYLNEFSNQPVKSAINFSLNLSLKHRPYCKGYTTNVVKSSVQ